jgi:tRNA threonylcarbamoyladenosine modification (KEOPS) complex  Pcc1 subunit
MRAELSLDLDDVETVGAAVEPSLSDNGENTFRTSTEDGSLDIEIQAAGSGPLRGCIDAAMRLTKLGEKITER